MSSDETRISTSELIALAEPVHVGTLTRWESDPYAGDVGRRALQSETFGHLGLVLTYGTDVLYGADLVDAQRHQPDDDGMVPAIDLAKAGYTRIKAEAAADALWSNARDSTVDAVLLAELRATVIQEDEMMAAAVGFDGDDLDALIEAIEQDEHNVGLLGDPDDVPEVEPEGEPVTKLGDVWRLGEHTLVCGDAYDAANMPDKCDAVLTDPPYGMNLDTDYTKMGSKSTKHAPVIGDDQPFDASAVPLPESSQQFWFGADWYRYTIPDGGSWLVWDKRNGANDEAFGSMFELCWTSERRRRTIFRHNWQGFTAADPGESRSHPTQKPVALVAEMIEMWVDESATVLDPFSGSGSTLIACHQTGRICHAIELDPHYCDVILTRFERATSIVPTRDGVPHSFVEAE